MMIKVCGITRREDAMAAADAGASAIGFIFYAQSPRYVTPETAAALGDALPLWKVGVFVNESSAAVEAVMRAANLDVAQIYGGQAPSHARVWRAFRMTSELGNPSPEGAEAILLDGPANGASFDWKLARAAVERIIVAGGLEASNVAEAIRIAQPWGVDASSRLETAPGVKDREKIRAFVKAARETSA